MKIEDKYKWLARDKNGKLWAYEDRPEKDKNNGHWSSVGFSNHVYIEEPTDEYSDISWEDKKPHLIFRITKEDYDLIENLDNINKPNHYIGIHGLEVEEVLQNFIPRYENSYAGHRVASAIEYLLRAPLKNKLEDIEKAKQNLEQILNYEKEQPHE